MLKCSGILLSSNIVLTAAHCVIDVTTNKVFAPYRIHFLQNVHGTRIAGHAKAKCVRFLPDYQFGVGAAGLPLLRRPQSLQFLARDVVAIVLADPLTIDPIPLLEAHEIKLGLRLVHASYPADRRYQLMADFQCRLIGVVQDLWLTDCDTHPAGSGGPIFARASGLPTLGAIMIGDVQNRVTLAVPITEWVESARGAQCGI